MRRVSSTDTTRRALFRGTVGMAGLAWASALTTPGQSALAAPLTESGDPRQPPIDRVIRNCLIKLGAILQRAASGDFGLAVDGERISTLHVGRLAVTMTPTSGLYLVDPIAYVDGVDVAFLHVTLPPDSTPKTQPGFYKVRAIAPITGVGEVEGLIQLFDSAGMVVLEHGATFETFSPVVPPDAEDFTLIHANLEALTDERSGVGLSEWCSNGTHWITGCDIWDFMSNGVYG